MNVEPWVQLSNGASGDAVRGMQHLLRAHGSGIAADGAFGPLTEAAVRDFQTAQTLPVDGIVGPITWGRLVIATSSGSTGEAVRGVQSFGLVLIPEQPPLVVDGIFGNETNSRVRLFQSLWGLAVDGIAGRNTWSYLGADKRTVWPLVRPGSTEADNFRVRTVQYLLRSRGFAIAADGIYGPQTAEAVRQFAMSQRAVDVDNVVGNLTWPALIVQVGPGSTGDAVKAVQVLFSELALDGVYGPDTEQMVKKFQETWGLTKDGVVGPITWRTLVIPKFD
ncbi:MAG: peptidoglycan-binding domain-containing protein [Acidimicrobiales bacterium]